MEWDIYAYELARKFTEFISSEFLAFLKEEMGMPNALQVDMFSAGLVDTSGVPLAGGKVYTYAAGTTTDKATYTDSAMTTPHTNPVILDGAGCKTVYAYGNYKFVVKDLNDVTIRTLDNQYYMIPSTTAEVVNAIAYADTPYTATAQNQLIKANTAGGNITIVLPTAVGNEGVEITVVKTHADNTLSIDQTGSETTNGSTSASTLTDVYGLLAFTSDNANWVISNNVATGTVTASSTTTLTNKTLTDPIINGTVTGTYTLGGTPTITAPAISSPVLSGTATGTYTLAGTPTITSPAISAPTITGTTTIAVEAWKTDIGLTTNWVVITVNTVDRIFRYRKTPFGEVELNGYILATDNAASNTPLDAALGSGYRPDQPQIFYNHIWTDITNHPIVIGTDGVITLGQSLNGEKVIFDGITFKAA